MVFFTCNACGQAIKKAMVEKHYRTKCPQCEVLSCIDCGKDFYGDEYKQHNQCISENEKYGGKGYQPPPGANKGEAKQGEWLQRIRDACSAGSVSSNIGSLMEKIAAYPNVPRKRKKFENFVSNSLRIYNPKIMEEVWSIFSQASSQQDTPPQAGTDIKPKVAISSTSSAPESAHDTNEGNDEDHHKQKKEKKKKHRDKTDLHIANTTGDKTEDDAKKQKKVKKDKKAEPEVEKLAAKIENESEGKSVKKKKNKVKHESETHDDDTKVSTKSIVRDKTSSENGGSSTTNLGEAGAPQVKKKKVKKETEVESQVKSLEKDSKESFVSSTRRREKKNCDIGGISDIGDRAASSTVKMKNNKIQTYTEENGVVSSHVTTFHYDGSDIIMTVKEHKKKTESTTKSSGALVSKMSPKQEKQNQDATSNEKKKKRKHEKTAPIMNGMPAEEKAVSSDEPSKKKSRKAHHDSNGNAKQDTLIAACKARKIEAKLGSKSKLDKKHKTNRSKSIREHVSSPSSEGEIRKKKKRKHEALSPGKSGNVVQKSTEDEPSEKKSKRANHVSTKESSEDTIGNNIKSKKKKKHKTKSAESKLGSRAVPSEAVSQNGSIPESGGEIQKAKTKKRKSDADQTAPNQSSKEVHKELKLKKKKTTAATQESIALPDRDIESAKRGNKTKKKEIVPSPEMRKKKSGKKVSVQNEQSEDANLSIHASTKKKKKREKKDDEIHLSTTKTKHKKLQDVSESDTGPTALSGAGRGSDDAEKKKHKKHKRKNISDVPDQEYGEIQPDQKAKEIFSSVTVSSADVKQKKKHKKHKEKEKRVSGIISANGDCSDHGMDVNLGIDTVKKKKKKKEKERLN